MISRTQGVHLKRTIEIKINEAVLAAGFFGIGVLGNFWCWRHHVCMAGHMEHPPYAFWHYLVDGGWAFSWGVTSWLLIRTDNQFAYVGAGVLVLLTAWRLLS